MASVAFAAVTKEREGRAVLRSLTLDVDDGTICCLVGPSGCGKSTAVRLLAGLEEPTSGEIRIDGRRVNAVPTRDRGLGMVTQTSALLPSRPTEDSVGLPLDLRHDIDRDERRWRIDEQALALDLGDVLGRPPSTLSGGEIQVAQIARAVIARPRVLLLDEPLARIDPARRGMVRADLVRLQQLYGVTTIWVTADQRDALAVADRVAVLLDGRLEQVGAPMAVYDRPRTLAVARFFGEPEIGVVRTRLGGRQLDVGIRPHELRAAAPGAEGTRFQGTVVGVEVLGRRAVATVAVEGGTLRWDGAPVRTRVGERLDLVVDPDRVHLFDADTGVAVGHPE
ncbi:ABC transporter ATP-binding protein [Acidimicrobiia bacterium EGI L10123]|uniref:ABC transporter ATP-binding protein n=1 Tax=Salinilacustrithrix flava TaxID=2957203 RepID=UPI003D7C24EE|nr:ABC transporter ATP-binding protein [Acidimicrobiia bacterium EGI L10123]